MIIFEPPLSLILSLCLVMISLLSMTVGIRRFVLSYKLGGEYASSIWLARGLRCVLISLTSLAWAAAIFFNKPFLFIIGAVVIFQELYEGFIIMSALKEGEKVEKGESSFSKEE